MARFFAITLTRELSGLRMPEIAERYKIASYRTDTNKANVKIN